MYKCHEFPRSKLCYQCLNRIGRFTTSGKISLGLRVTLSEQKKKRVSEANQKYLRKIGENEQQYYTMAQESRSIIQKRVRTWSP